MKIYVADDYKSMSRKAANLVSAQIILKPNCVLGLATGSTPIGLYEQLADWYEKGDLDFTQVKTVNLDEYVGLRPDHPQSYRYFMQKNLFSRVNIQLANTHVPNGMADDIEAECRRYTTLIHDMGGIDVQVLGMGHNGHIGFNEPGEAFELETHLVNLTESTIKANSRFFDSMDEVPRSALTMGTKTIMQARRIVMVVSGEEKADIVEAAFRGPITPHVPASILQMHPNLTLIGDREALCKIL